MAGVETHFGYALTDLHIFVPGEYEVYQGVHARSVAFCNAIGGSTFGKTPAANAQASAAGVDYVRAQKRKLLPKSGEGPDASFLADALHDYVDAGGDTHIWNMAALVNAAQRVAGGKEIASVLCKVWDRPLVDATGGMHQTTLVAVVAVTVCRCPK